MKVVPLNCEGTNALHSPPSFTLSPLPQPLAPGLQTGLKHKRECVGHREASPQAPSRQTFLMQTCPTCLLILPQVTPSQSPSLNSQPQPPVRKRPPDAPIKIRSFPALPIPSNPAYVSLLALIIDSNCTVCLPPKL